MTRKGWLLFAAMSVIWGIPYLFIKIAVRELDPGLVVFARAAIATAVLLPVALQRRVLGQLRGRLLLMVAGMAFLQIVAPFLLISYGEQHIASSLTSLFIASNPLLVALFALRLDPGERVNGLRLAGLLIGVVGVAALLGLDVGGDQQKLLGAIMVMLAAAFYAVAALFVKRPSIASAPRLGVVTMECLTATLVLVPLAVTRLPARLPSIEVLASLVVLGLVCTALAYLTFFALIAEVGAIRGAVVTYVNPAVSVLFGVLLLGEPLTVATVAGFLLIIAGSWVATGGKLPLKRARTRQQPQAGQEVTAVRQNALEQQGVESEANG